MQGFRAAPLFHTDLIAPFYGDLTTKPITLRRPNAANEDEEAFLRDPDMQIITEKAEFFARAVFVLQLFSAPDRCISAVGGSDPRQYFQIRFEEGWLDAPKKAR